ncbi:hypothetical protein [Nocardia sp. NPDC060249]|uniref:hypothetical protein n=1 Tax=Nocardia sp. NPDC060249 TaxID=3347082 RepID=UPI00364692C7
MEFDVTIEIPQGSRNKYENILCVLAHDPHWDHLRDLDDAPAVDPVSFFPALAPQQRMTDSLGGQPVPTNCARLP